jgi:hypothetical protein
MQNNCTLIFCCFASSPPLLRCALLPKWFIKARVAQFANHLALWGEKSIIFSLNIRRVWEISRFDGQIVAGSSVVCRQLPATPANTHDNFLLSIFLASFEKIDKLKLFPIPQKIERVSSRGNEHWLSTNFDLRLSYFSTIKTAFFSIKFCFFVIPAVWYSRTPKNSVKLRWCGRLRASLERRST